VYFNNTVSIAWRFWEENWIFFYIILYLQITEGKEQLRADLRVFSLLIIFLNVDGGR
jgi:hypothetical protein